MDRIAENSNSPIFIVGTPRSGTTLTARILSKHSRIFIAGETHFFDEIYPLSKKMGDVPDDSSLANIIKQLLTLYRRHNELPDQERIDHLLLADPKAFHKLKSCCKGFRDIFSSFMEIQMISEGKVRWGNCLPRDIFNIDDILSFYPDAKILICIRDVRDFLLSYKFKWRATSQDRVNDLKRMYHPVVTSLLWKSSMRLIPSIESKVMSDNFMIVKYEELVQKPEEVISKICKVVGEKFEKWMFEVGSHNSSFQVKCKGIFSYSVGRWRRSLGREEAYTAQVMTGKEMQRFGYPIEKIYVNPIKVALIFASLPFALWRALDVGKGKRGPLITYIKRRVASLF